MANSWISILSLVVAALAVFFGPLISLWVARRQMLSSLATANKQIIAPMRQAWINSLRDLIADLISSTLHYYVSGFENRSDEEYQRLCLLEYKIVLMLNAREKEHQQLELLIRQLINNLGQQDQQNIFPDLHNRVTSLSRDILKQEWNRVKAPLDPLHDS